MTTQPRPVALGDWVTFLVDGDGEQLHGRVTAVHLETVHGMNTAEWAEPVHHVSIPSGGLWAIHPSWIIETRTTPTPTRERWLISHPEMLGVLQATDAIAVDLDQLTPDQIDQAIKAEDMGYIPADVLEMGHNLADLIADGLRWRAYMATHQTGVTP